MLVHGDSFVWVVVEDNPDRPRRAFNRVVAGGFATQQEADEARARMKASGSFPLGLEIRMVGEVH